MCREAIVKQQIEDLGERYALHPANNAVLQKNPTVLTTQKIIQKKPTILTQWLKEQHGAGNRKAKASTKTKRNSC